MDLVCLAEDVKLSANGRQPTLLTLLLLIFFMIIIKLDSPLEKITKAYIIIIIIYVGCAMLSSLKLSN